MERVCVEVKKQSSSPLLYTVFLSFTNTHIKSAYTSYHCTNYINLYRKFPKTYKSLAIAAHGNNRWDRQQVKRQSRFCELEVPKLEVMWGELTLPNLSWVIKLSVAERRDMTVVVWNRSHNLQLKMVKSEAEERERVAPLPPLIEMKETLTGFCWEC